LTLLAACQQLIPGTTGGRDEHPAGLKHLPFSGTTCYQEEGFSLPASCSPLQPLTWDMVGQAGLYWPIPGQTVPWGLRTRRASAHDMQSLWRLACLQDYLLPQHLRGHRTNATAPGRQTSGRLRLRAAVAPPPYRPSWAQKTSSSCAVFLPSFLQKRTDGSSILGSLPTSPIHWTAGTMTNIIMGCHVYTPSRIPSYLRQNSSTKFLDTLALFYHLPGTSFHPEETLGTLRCWQDGAQLPPSGLLGDTDRTLHHVRHHTLLGTPTCLHHLVAALPCLVALGGHFTGLCACRLPYPATLCHLPVPPQPPSTPCWDMPSCIPTPHISFPSNMDSRIFPLPTPTMPAMPFMPACLPSINFHAVLSYRDDACARSPPAPHRPHAAHGAAVKK